MPAGPSRHHGKFASRSLFSCLAAVLLAACAGIPRNAVEIADLQFPQSPGIVGARYWADVEPPNIDDVIKTRERQRRAAGLGGNWSDLTLSGGGENGAFAAGILTAWSESGTRPEFLNITGVSTGALIAPFAFLGPDYDDELRRLYGGLPPERIYAPRSLFGILPNASLTSSDPLRQLIEEYISDDFLEEIAAQHRRGRRLLVQTVSLDAQRPVLWDLGAIANSSSANATEVFRDVLLASASIPGLFQPVLIEVETESGPRDELHVDGGVFSQSAFLPGWKIPRIMSGRPTLYAIRNAKVTPEPQITPAGLIPVTGRSVGTLIKSQGTSDLRIAYKLGKPQGAVYNATWISEDFTVPKEEPFDPQYMQSLFDYGYQRFKSGNLWSNRPP